MNNNYYEKYLKYKKKYSNLKNKQIGGYNLSDPTEGFMLDNILRKILSKKDNNKYFIFNRDGGKEESYKFNETFNFLLNDQKYNEIFSYLLKEYMNEKKYEQVFFNKTDSTPISNFPDMIPYHINIGALMFLSFIVELEIFTLFHSIIPYNTLLQSNRNNINTAFCGIEATGECTKTRIYNDNVSSTLFTLFNTFTYNLDKTFYEFMKNLVTNISSKYEKMYNDILKCIVPTESSVYKEGESQFNFIFVDWKKRLNEFLGVSGVIGTINKIICDTINQIENEGLIYIAESTGFFSYMFLVNPIDSSKQYGSCITYSMFELYIMSRLHTHGKNMALLIEKQITYPHGYWKLTQTRTNIEVLTHYATKFKLKDNQCSLRSIFIQNEIVELPFASNKKKILKLFIYIIYDMYIQYIKSYTRYTFEQKEKIRKIMFFIRKRINNIETLLESNDVISNLNNDTEIKQYLINLSKTENHELINLDLDEIFKKPNIINILSSIGIYELIYNAITNFNFELVYNIVNIKDIDISGKYLEKSILIMILEKVIVSKINNKLIIKIIAILLSKPHESIGDITKIIKYKNIKLYNKIKILLKIPDLTYDMLLHLINDDRDFDSDYITNEILLNTQLLKEINERKVHNDSLLYLVCKKRKLSIFRNLIKVNEISNQLLIDVNVKNLENYSTPLHGVIWGEHGKINENVANIPIIISELLKNGADKTITNIGGELPINNIRVELDPNISKKIRSLLT